MLDFVEEALDQVTLLIDEPIHLAGFCAVSPGRNDRRHTPCLDGLDEFFAVIALVADEGFSPCRRQFQQRFGLAHVTGLPARQHKVQWVTQGISDGMDLGAESAPRAAQRLSFGVARRCPGGAGVGADDRRVNKDALQIR